MEFIEFRSCNVGEAKRKDDIYGTVLDLIRIGRFSKHSIGVNNLEGILGIHVVGLTATVYQTSLIDSGLYVILVICSINMSRDATQLRSYLAVCENRLPIHNLYKNHCGVVEDIANVKAKMAIQASVKRCSRK